MIMMRRYLILLIFTLPFFYGCSLATQLMYMPEINRAETLLQQGQNKEAAAIYKRLASLNTNQQHQFRMMAADALIGAGDAKQAKKYTESINPTRLTSKQFNHLKLLHAQIALSEGDAERALMLLKSMDARPLDNRARVSYLESLAFAHSLSGDTIKSAQTLIMLDPYIRSPKKLRQHHEKILKTLMTLSPHTLHIKQPLAANTLSGWMGLARIFKTQQFNLPASLSKWRKLYPYHPANSDFLLSHEKKYQRKLSRPSTIALMLPESGRYAKAARVVKNGFMAAYNQANREGRAEAKVKFYNTESSHISQLYKKAVNDGAQLVVGPLNKAHLQSLLESVELTVPVLALNHIEGLSHPHLFQFGLSPIDDGEQIALKAIQDGYKNALVLIPKSSRGERIGRYFSRHWQRLGGNIVDMHVYNPADQDFNNAVKAIAGNAAAADMVFMNAYARQASSLNPHLQYRNATASLPVYATSHLYLGMPDRSRDNDLDGITFCDVPWVFESVYSGSLSKFSLQSLWLELSPSYMRLVPLGIDAYNMIPHLGKMRRRPYSGATGKLTLGADNRVNRELFCARFIDGEPDLRNFASEKSLFAPPAAATGIQTPNTGDTVPAASSNPPALNTDAPDNSLKVSPPPQLPEVKVRPYVQ